jgi:hypothetical protein
MMFGSATSMTEPLSLPQESVDEEITKSGTPAKVDNQEKEATSSEPNV